MLQELAQPGFHRMPGNAAIDLTQIMQWREMQSKLCFLPSVQVLEMNMFGDLALRGYGGYRERKTWFFGPGAEAGATGLFSFRGHVKVPV